MPKDDVIRFRTDAEFVARFKRIASVLRRNESDLSRIIFEDYVAEQERQLGLTGYGVSSAGKPPSPRQQKFLEVVRRGKKPSRKQ